MHVVALLSLLDHWSTNATPASVSFEMGSTQGSSDLACSARRTLLARLGGPYLLWARRILLARRILGFSSLFCNNRGTRAALVNGRVPAPWALLPATAQLHSYCLSHQGSHAGITSPLGSVTLIWLFVGSGQLESEQSMQWLPSPAVTICFTRVSMLCTRSGYCADMSKCSSSSELMLYSAHVTLFSEGNFSP